MRHPAIRLSAADLIERRPRVDRLDRVIQQIVRRCVAGSLLASLAGCAGTDPLAAHAPALAAADSDFDAVDCSAGAWDPVPHLTPSQSFDYASLRVIGTLDPNAGPMIQSQVGTACAGATDPGACAGALEVPPSSLEMNHCGMAGCSAHFVATTLGDVVQQWSTREELLAFLGPIDSSEDALLVAFYDGYHLGHDVLGGCDTAAVRKTDAGYEIYATRTTKSCSPVQITRYLLRVAPSGELTVLKSAVASEENACIGRRPRGLHAEDVRADCRLGAFFARHAQLEAASVHAFEHMIAELTAHAAPRALLEAARAAREDEIRHARLVRALAHRYGARVPPIRVEAAAPRPLLAMAIENATEGCVRETWGALLGTFQAQRVGDPELAAAFAQIAADERRHAMLSWRVGEWLDGRLTPVERAQVACAYRHAIDALRDEESWPKSASIVQTAGLPDVATARVLLDELETHVWAAA